MAKYNPAIIEPKWQKYWEEHRTFAAPRLPLSSASSKENEICPNPLTPNGQNKMYILDMFPYPSANGLHVGHPEGYTATDIVARFYRMNQVSVLHPMGWDAFGLPAEQHAKKTGIHPRITTEKNIANFRRQLKMLGFSYDWDREVATTDVEYFRWTQRIFLILFDTWFDPIQKKGRPIAELPIPDDVQAEGKEAVRVYIDEHRLAYQIEAPVNWCPELGTVLANEEVVGGVSERGGYPVQRLPLRQWMLRITAYAERLEEDLDPLDWSESIKILQRNWIGKSTGAEVDFFIGSDYSSESCESNCTESHCVKSVNTELGKPSEQAFNVWKAKRKSAGFPRKPESGVLRVFTTRPDTLFGATYMVIAPEHPAVKRLTTPAQAEAVQKYCEQAAFKSDLDRTDLAKEKTGVFTGSYARNPVNGALVPVWVADYVLISYGTGAIMSVPAHDTRDFEFAKQFDIPMIQVVAPGKDSAVSPEDAAQMKIALTEMGVAVNSGKYDGMPSAEFKIQMTADLSEIGVAKKTVNYKLRDWLFSRQHFWGEPFPLLRELDENGQPNGVVVPLSPEDLPLDVPTGVQFDANHHTPEPPLEKAPNDWLYVEQNGKRYIRETNTMPQWAGSCWYYLRYLDPRNHEMMIAPEIEKAWMPVDLYVGGAEHAVLHLLYARFWHKVLFDRGLVSTPEPFHKLVNQGMILGDVELTGYQTADGIWVSAADVSVDNQFKATRKSDGLELQSIKMDVKQLVKKGDAFVLASDESIAVDSKSYKMSKSRGNVINPDEVVAKHGADALRLYEMFMGPLEAVKPWSQDGVSGVRGFLDRVWRLIVAADPNVDSSSEQANNEQANNEPTNNLLTEKSPVSESSVSQISVLSSAVQDVLPTEEQNHVLHKTIKAVTADIRNMSFNTAIARMMEFTNFFGRQQVRPKTAMESLVLILAPFAPHIAEELWQILGHNSTLAYENWPVWSEEATKLSRIVIPVQINGKLRAKLEISADADAQILEQAALADEKIAQLLTGKTIVKKIVVPGKMVNFVVK